MKPSELLDQILPILHSVKDNEEKLQQILDFLLEEIDEEPDDEVAIPEKYRKLVYDIAESIDCGMICFVNPDTLEMEDVPKSMLDEYLFVEEDEDEESGEADEMLNMDHLKWERCITVEPRDSRESFRIMEGFVSEIDDQKLQKQLINALSNHRPFANFKYRVESSPCRKEWFAYKQQKLEELVWIELSWQLEKDVE
jgi:hypothetical protein